MPHNNDNDGIIDPDPPKPPRPASPAPLPLHRQALPVVPAPAPTPGQPGKPDYKFGKGSFVALVGAACAAVAVPVVQQWEGNKLVPYRDIVGVWTVCTGDTNNVVPGQKQTVAQCEERLEKQLIAHTKPVLQCVPGLKDRPNQLAASISLAYNIGTGGFCKSSIARNFRANQWRAGCNAFILYSKAGGRTIQGLVNRRRAEIEICLRGL